MPHLQIQYSPHLAQTHDISALCKSLAECIIKTELFPKGGLRVRAFETDHAYIADGHQENAFVDLIFRIGAGRSDAQKKQTGAELMHTVEAFFADIKDDGYLMLSLEIIEIQKSLSWKSNSVHARLEKENQS